MNQLLVATLRFSKEVGTCNCRLPWQVDECKINILDNDLRRQLYLTMEDLRFADYLVKNVLDDSKDIFLDTTCEGRILLVLTVTQLVYLNVANWGLKIELILFLDFAGWQLIVTTIVSTMVFVTLVGRWLVGFSFCRLARWRGVAQGPVQNLSSQPAEDSTARRWVPARSSAKEIKLAYFLVASSSHALVNSYKLNHTSPKTVPNFTMHRNTPWNTLWGTSKKRLGEGLLSWMGFCWGILQKFIHLRSLFKWYISLWLFY